jgi:hypothetical protein
MAFKEWAKQNVTLAVVTSSLVAAVFTWWVNRPTPTTIAYVATRTSTGADAASISLVPNLSLRIGDEPIAGIFSHVFEFYVRDAYLEKLPLAITFDRDVRIFGKSVEAPSTLQSILCTQHPRGLTCELSRLDPNQNAPFRVSIATEMTRLPTIDVAGPNTRLIPLSEVEPQEQWWRADNIVLGVVSLTMCAITYLTFRTYLNNLKRVQVTLARADFDRSVAEMLRKDPEIAKKFEEAREVLRKKNERA